MALLVLGLCWSAYMINGDPLPGNDQQANMLMSVNLLKHASLSIDPRQAPENFIWQVNRPREEPSSGTLSTWSAAAQRSYETGELTAHPKYYLVPSTHPQQYVGTFGLGASLTALPVYGLLDLFVDVASNRYWWWQGAKLTASLLVAFTALLVFLTLLHLVPMTSAVLGALAFGLGSNVWSISSQALWQQTPYLLFLVLGAYFLFISTERKSAAAYCGMALGMAVLCRPTGAFAVVCVGVYFLSISRSLFLYYVLGGLPVAFALGAYNAYYFGSLFTFGQTLAGESIAQLKLGDGAGVWSLSTWVEGFAGLLVSPSRGLVFYSPVMLFGFFGVLLTWRQRQRFAALIPLQVAMSIEFAVEALHFDWWGGWTYGPRPLVGTMGFLALSMAPAMETLVRTRWLRRLLIALLMYSFAIQFIGAWSYNLIGWNNKGNMNIDEPQHRHRLWSISDNQIMYYATDLATQRDVKLQIIENNYAAEGPIVTARPPSPRSLK